MNDEKSVENAIQQKLSLLIFGWHVKYTTSISWRWFFFHSFKLPEKENETLAYHISHYWENGLWNISEQNSFWGNVESKNNYHIIFDRCLSYHQHAVLMLIDDCCRANLLHEYHVRCIFNGEETKKKPKKKKQAPWSNTHSIQFYRTLQIRAWCGNCTSIIISL